MKLSELLLPPGYSIQSIQRVSMLDGLLEFHFNLTQGELREEDLLAGVLAEFHSSDVHSFELDIKNDVLKRLGLPDKIIIDRINAVVTIQLPKG